VLAALKKWIRKEAEEFFEICVTSPGNYPAALQIEVETRSADFYRQGTIFPINISSFSNFPTKKINFKYTNSPSSSSYSKTRLTTPSSTPIPKTGGWGRGG
jgi:hypothetical protein